jgi:MYXO-CTERM domain-containing protein
MIRIVAALSAVAALLLSSAARGDAVPPPPTDCTPGTEGKSDHNCEYCSARTCSAGSPCAEGTTCQAASVCVGTVSCVNRQGSWEVDHVSGPCQSGACSQGSCRSLNVCLPETASGRGCSCTVAASPWTGGGTLLLLTALALRRRRRGSPRSQ